MRRRMHRFSILPLIILIAGLLFIGCENPTGSNDDAGSSTDDAGETSDDTTDETTDDSTEESVETTEPPENLLGTLALTNGKAAVMDVSFTADTSGSSAVAGGGGGEIRGSATFSISGTVRYEQQDYSVSGSYDSETAELELTATNDSRGTFTISGTYDESDGFSGTVSLKDSGGTEIATGQVGAPGVATSDRDNVSIFLGSFGGSSYGSWNGTVTSSRFYGTYQASDGRAYQGTFSADLSGGSVSGTATGIPFGGDLDSGEGFISGWYSGDWTEDGETVRVSGTWSGSEVDSSNDRPVTRSESPTVLVTNLMVQTLTSIVRKAESGIDYDGLASAESLEIGADVSDYAGIDSATFYLTNDTNESGFTSFIIVLAADGYDDDITGISLSQGEIYAEYGPAFVYSFLESSKLVVDSDVTTNDTKDDGVTVTFPDDSSAGLYVNGTIDADGESIGGDWEFPLGQDPPADVGSILQGVVF